jgi:hypothetical protein
MQRTAPKASDDIEVQGKIKTFTGLLVVVGFLQLFALIGQVAIYCRQAKIMARQAHEAKRQRGYMRLQWKTMRQQVTEMQGTAKQTAKLIEHAGIQADASLESAHAASANVEAFIQKERARIKVQVHPFDLQQPILLGHSVKYSVVCIGPTIASIDYAVAEATVTDSVEPETDTIIIFGNMEIGPFISPGMAPIDRETRTQVLSRADADGLTQGTKFVHFRGNINYRDFMGKERETCFCWTWKMVSPIRYLAIGEWKPSGPPEANRET